MFKLPVLLAFCFLAVEALPTQERILGGTTANISQFPFAAILLVSENNAAFRQNCGGTILNNRSIMSAAHCWDRRGVRHQVRVGSTNASSGGAVHNVQRHITHGSYVNSGGHIISDIGIVRLATAITLGGSARAGRIPGPNVNTADNTLVSAIGWGILGSGGRLSETLQHVQLRVFARSRCQGSYNAQIVNARTICAGWETNGRGACTGDSGGPLVHNGVAIGVLSFGGPVCGETRFPNVYARTASYNSWILNNA